MRSAIEVAVSFSIFAMSSAREVIRSFSDCRTPQNAGVRERRRWRRSEREQGRKYKTGTGWLQEMSETPLWGGARNLRCIHQWHTRHRLPGVMLYTALKKAPQTNLPAPPALPTPQLEVTLGKSDWTFVFGWDFRMSTTRLHYKGLGFPVVRRGFGWSEAKQAKCPLTDPLKRPPLRRPLRASGHAGQVKPR